MTMLTLDVIKLCEGDNVLAGVAEGAFLLAKMIQAVAMAETEEVVFIDFSDVHIATASFLRESVLGFRDYCRQRRSNLYPVAANLGLRVLEELESLLRLSGDVLVICETTKTGVAKTARVLGKLEDKQRLTLNAVSAAREADALTLQQRFPEDKTKITAWHNRLTALCAKSILMERQNGRVKTYRPVLEALSYGS